ncbi:hypothetical protein ASE86_12170 [Sphingomonas sp. Leaf33]|uniref:DUF2059 domain-containing protein n=1 Tax=Sphingomonas sp. Leaf33 TaxID=1736215 RepID=UPI0007008225|nr:DUF2059 domain-containing protein [Sphingomonas sp. Leaf33]KQN19264.1 hypothetical protein ASE86_12170 [Sphingomonas sp. Leaf33]
MILLALLLQATPAPTAEAARLGTEIARSGTFSQIAPVLVQQQTDELVRDTKGLSLADQAALRAVAAETGRTMVDRVTERMGVAYAGALSTADMRTILAFNRTDAARRYRAAEPNAMAAAAQSMGGMDFKRDVLKAFCATTGKGCPAK